MFSEITGIGDVLGIALGLFMSGTLLYSLYRLFKSDDPLGIKPNINIYVNVQQEEGQKKD